MHVAVYGGSFNPPHLGHAMVASWLLWTGRVDRVWLLPAYQHAFDKELAPFELRARLCRVMAAELDPRVEVCEVERELPTPSYTYNTLSALAERHPGLRLRLVLGADNLSTVHLWHRWPELRARFDPILVGRQGSPEVPDAPSFPDISSTEVRRRLAARQPVEHLLSVGVRAALAALPPEEEPWCAP